MNKINRNIFLSVRRTINTFLGLVPFLDTNKVVVFCYHAIGSDNWRFSNDIASFKKQVNYLLKTRTPITGEELFTHIKSGKKIIGRRFLITFDDGYKDILKVRDFLRENKIKPIVFLLSDNKKANRTELENSRPFLSESDILQLKQDGWEIGSHSATHPNIQNLTENELKIEIGGSKLSLEKKLGFKIQYFAYPKGKYSEKIVAEVKRAKYRLAFTVDGGLFERHENRFLLPRVGVDRSHLISEFPGLYSLVTIGIRKLVRIVEVKMRTPLFLNNLRRNILLFLKRPIAFTYSFTYSTKKIIKIYSYNPSVNLAGQELLSKIRKAAPGLKLHFVGSASLKIAGQKDIDLLAECNPKLFDIYLPKLVSLFGQKYKRRSNFIEWHMGYKGNSVQFMMIDPNSTTFKDLINIYTLFKKNRQILSEYESIKWKSNGLCEREYKRTRMEFFNRVLNI